MAHNFHDYTNLPGPTIDTAQIRMVIEAGPDVEPTRKGDKPPYQVPSMAEIAALPWNGLNVVSTFAGCGGSSTGYRMAGFRVLWANEVNGEARRSYAANMRDGTILDGRGIRDVSTADVLDKIGLEPGRLDVLDGSPPCVSFSTAGRRHKDWGKVKEHAGVRQRTDDLFFEFVRLVDGLRPKVFVAENVYGLVKGTAKGYFLEILSALKGCGYRVEARLLDAQWLGVPQTRRRLFFMGVREDLGRAPAFPRPLPYRYSVRDALPWLASAVHDSRGIFNDAGECIDRASATVTRTPADFKVKGVGGIRRTGFGAGKMVPAGLPSPTIMANGGMGMNTYQFGIEVEADISRFAIGREWDRVGPGGQSDKYFQLVRPNAGEPSPTITSSGGTSSLAAVTHPTERRKFAIAELRRICGFPDDFVLTGTYAQQWERLGNAVPPVMMYHVAMAIRDNILGRRLA